MTVVVGVIGGVLAGGNAGSEVDATVPRSKPATPSAGDASDSSVVGDAHDAAIARTNRAQTPTLTQGHQ